MKALFIIIFAISYLNQLPAQNDNNLIWNNLQTTYESIFSVKPNLSNTSDSSIYFIKAWPFVSAITLRFNELSDKWEKGQNSCCCYTVAYPCEPIELKPTDTITINLYLTFTVDTLENEKTFVLSNGIIKRPLRGLYKLIMYYAKEPWTLCNKPKKNFYTQSPEFTISY